MLRIRSIMTTDVTTVSPELSLREAMELLTRRQISGAPVVAGEDILGVVSTSDLVAFASSLPGVQSAPSGVPDEIEWDAPATAAELDEMDVSETGFFSELWGAAGADVVEQMAAAEEHMLNELEQHVVREVMSTDLVTLPSDTTVKEAADILRRRRIHRVLVVDDGELVGILSTLDIASAVADGRLTTRTYIFNRDQEFAS
jgi:CBS domain-containing protein